MTIRSRFQARLDPPPSNITGEFGNWLQRLTDTLNKFPAFSTFSGDPNSAVTGAIGALGVNVSSSTSALWVKQVGSGNTGWGPVG